MCARTCLHAVRDSSGEREKQAWKMLPGRQPWNWISQKCGTSCIKEDGMEVENRENHMYGDVEVWAHLYLDR